ncbi:MAG TPA: DUF5916 domain-containing protein [Gammaproteobacteria bacterium]|nr:DUF5916 domain-containing protein [Gammaproteobacteria bacterium]
MLRGASAILALALAQEPCLAQQGPEGDAPVKNVRVQRAAEPPTIDGVLDEEVWLRAPVIDDFHQITPVEFDAPSERTEVYVLYDRDALYIGARLYDSEPGLINARILRQGQAIGSDDRFFVHIDPFNNRRSGYLFGVNPNGVRYDGIFEGVTQRRFDWDGIWQAAANVTPEGWVVEIEIPFKTISFDPQALSWRMNFARNIERNNEGMAWMSRNRNTDLSTMGDATGISQIEQGRGLDVVPSMSVSDRRAIGTTPGDSAAEPSVDVYYKITPQLNASLTLNTDFSATEVDDRQVNLTRFSLFFPERRDFFLQDVDIFQFGRLSQDGRPFFSRRIGIGSAGQVVPIDVGAKISGRIGRFDVGTLAVRQEAYDNTFGGTTTTVDATTAFVGRVAANVLEESSVGMIVTQGDTISNLDNSVVGVDFRYVNSQLIGGRALEGDAWLQQSDSENLVGDDTAWGLGVSLPSNTGLRGEVGLSRIEANFNPALGFVRRRGIDQTSFNVGNTWRPRDGAIRTISTGLNANRIEYLDENPVFGSLQSQGVGLQVLNLEFDSQDGLGLNVNNSKEGLREPFMVSRGVTIPEGVYSFDTVNLQLRSGDQRAFGGGLFLNDGEFYDGERKGFTTFVGWRSPHFRANLNYQYNEVAFPGKGSQMLANGQTRCTRPDCDFVTRVVRLSLEAIFSSKLSWINLIQYDNVSDTIGINSRLHWIPQAGREGFLVLNHNLREEPLRPDTDYHTSLAEVTLKYSYTFRF